MRKLIIAFLFVLICIPSLSFGAIARVAGGCQGMGVNGGTTGSSVNFTGANFLVVSLSWDKNQAQPTFSSTNISSGSWHFGTLQTGSSNKNIVGYAYNVAPTSEQFTTSGTNIFSSVCYLGFSGVKSSADPFDQQNGATGGGGVNNISTGSITPGEDNEVIVSTFGGIDGTNHVTVSLLTQEADILFSAGNYYSNSIAYQIQTTATARNPNWNWTDASKTAAVTVNSFKSAPASTAARRCSLLGVC